MPPLLTTQEMCHLLRVSRRTLRRMVLSGVLPCVRVNSRVWRFRPGAVEKWLERKEQ